jgi:putative nucleotidyltransferase with HDIG domain
MPDRSPEQLEAAVRAAAGSGAIPLAALAESRTRLIETQAFVESDVALALGFLKRANAAPSAQAVTIEEAVDAIGPGGVRAVVDSLPLFDPLVSHADTAASPDRMRIHAVQVRDLAERLAQIVGHRDVSLLRTAAVLHDIGKSVIASAVPSYARLLFNPEAPDVRLAREREALGIDHAEAGALLLEVCGMPRPLVGAVRAHHAPETAAGPEAPLLALADMLAHYRGGRRIDAVRLVETAALVGLRRDDVGALLYDLGEPLTATVLQPYPCPLSPGELQAVRGLARGMLYKEIAAELGVSPATVRNQIHRAYRKVGARDRAHIVLIAGDRGWL